MKSKLDVYKRALEIMIEAQSRQFYIAGICLAINKVESEAFRDTPLDWGFINSLCKEAKGWVVAVIYPHYTVSGWLFNNHTEFAKETEARVNVEEGWTAWITQYRIEWLKRIIADLEGGQNAN